LVCADGARVVWVNTHRTAGSAHGGVKKVVASIVAIMPMGMAAVVLLVIMNGVLDVLGLK